jgi:TIR domain
LGLPARYQIVILDPGARPWSVTLRETLRTRVHELGLDPDQDLRFLDQGNYAGEFQSRDPVVAVYFGGPTRSVEAERVLTDLLGRFAFVLPIVDSTDAYSSKVPDSLHLLNGAPIESEDPRLERIAGRLLEELRLVPRRRVAFVSYRRAESRGVGSQIFHALEERHFRVFLDTVSVQYGRTFQEALWNRMLDTDVLVFLHTPGALDSQWVEREFARASQLGLGILNVIWPGHSPALAAAIGEQVYLDPSDFSPGLAPNDGGAELKPDVLLRLAAAVEALRTRAVADRRRRVVDTFCRRVDAFVRRTGVSALEVVVQTAGHLVVRRGLRSDVRVYPVVGHPDTTHAREVADACSVLDEKGYLVFDANGIDEATAAHLRWLNRFLPIISFSTAEAEEWIPRF